MASATYYPSPVAGVPTWDIDPYSTDVLADPEPWYSGLRDRGPIVWLSRYGCWAVGGYAEVRAVFSDAQRFCSSRGVGLADFSKDKPWRAPSIILEVDPPEHDRTRRVMIRALSPSAVEELGASFEREADALVESLLARDHFDAVADCAEVFPLTVFPDAVGLTAKDREQLLVYGRMVFNALGPDNELRQMSLAAGAAVVPWITEQCARPALTAAGFGASIYDAADRGEISETEAGLLVRSLLSAGVDTTVAAIGAALRYFSEYPQQWELLRERPDLIRNAFEEVCRLASPVHAFFRTANAATEVAGVAVEDGAKIMCVLGAANTDPAKWEAADRFDITRKLTGHVAFGAGIHACVGQHVARKEGEVLLRTLSKRVRRMEPLAAAAWRPGNALRTLACAPMRFVPV